MKIELDICGTLVRVPRPGCPASVSTIIQDSVGTFIRCDIHSSGGTINIVVGNARFWKSDNCGKTIEAKSILETQRDLERFSRSNEPDEENKASDA